MYESFFGMEHTPFVRDIPAEKLYESDAFRETLGRLCYVADRQMFAVVTADPGCGKSTLIRRFYKGMLDQLGLEARFLLNYRFDSVSPMAVVLVGQTELWDNKLKLQRYAAIRQRIDMYCTLPHLDRAETEQYVKSHMDYAECSQEIFTTKAMDEIHKASAGIPRMVNRVCEKSLMYAFQQQKRLIDDYMIKYVVEHEMLGTVTG